MECEPIEPPVDEMDCDQLEDGSNYKDDNLKFGKCTDLEVECERIEPPVDEMDCDQLEGGSIICIEVNNNSTA